MYSDALSYDTLFERLIQRKEKLALIGLGYVGMPIAIEFAKHLDVIGYNHNEYSNIKAALILQMRLATTLFLKQL